MTEDSKPLYKDYLKASVTLIGAGGIISNALAMFAKLSPPKLTIWDDDKVANVNLAMQQFHARDIGKFKVEVLMRDAKRINPDLTVRVQRRRFRAQDALDGVVVSGVDCMESRQLIFDAVRKQRNQIQLYLDGRLSRKHHEYFDLFVIDPNDAQDVEAYEDWLHEGSNIKDLRPENMAVQTPVMLAGTMGVVLARWSEGRSRPWRVSFFGDIPHLEFFFHKQ